jgi:hypothetical protein
VQIYDLGSDSLEPPVLARRVVRRNLRLFAALGMTGGAIMAFILSGRMLTRPTPALVLGLTVGCALLFSVPVFVLSFKPPPRQVATLEARVESSRRSGKPIRALSTTFLMLVFVGGIVFAAAAATLIPLSLLNYVR